MNRNAIKLNTFPFIKSNKLKCLFNLCFVIVFLLLLSACKEKPKSIGPKYGELPLNQKNTIYHFGVHPLYNPAKLMECFNPLINYLNQNTNGAEFKLEASKDYSNYEEKYKNKKLDFLLPNPWQTLQAIKHGYAVIAESGESNDFKGIFIVRKDSKIKYFLDIKGKTVSYPSPTALAACIMPQYFLYKHGIDINKDISNLYVGSQESSIMNVYYEKTSIGATWPVPWRAFKKEFPKESSQLKIIWETEPLINNSVMVRNDIPENIKKLVQTKILELNSSKEGRKILLNMEISRFIKATNKDYDIVQTYTNRFEKEVRKIE